MFRAYIYIWLVGSLYIVVQFFFSYGFRWSLVLGALLGGALSALFVALLFSILRPIFTLLHPKPSEDELRGYDLPAIGNSPFEYCRDVVEAMETVKLRDSDPARETIIAERPSLHLGSLKIELSVGKWGNGSPKVQVEIHAMHPINFLAPFNANRFRREFAAALAAGTAAPA